MFSSWRLHARINSETSHQVLLPLDSWHAHHSFDVIKTHQPDVAELIPHISLIVRCSIGQTLGRLTHIPSQGNTIVLIGFEGYIGAQEV